MNQVLAGSAALVLAIVLWGLGRKPKSLSMTAKTSWMNSSLSTLPTLVGIDSSDSTFQNASKERSNIHWQPPQNIKERIILTKNLHKAISSHPEDRLHAVSIASLWGHPSVLPVLRRGLKDSNAQVVQTAAAALQNHRGKTTIWNKPQDTLRPPLNVSRMR